MESVAARIDEETKRYLESEAHRLDTSISEVVRMILESSSGQDADVDRDDNGKLTIDEMSESLEELVARIETLEHRTESLKETQKTVVMHTDGLRLTGGALGGYDAEPPFNR